MSAPSALQFGDIGIDPSWSHFVEVPSHGGGSHRWHVLERRGLVDDAPTILCIHGNPTWSFLWSRLISEIDPSFRIVAPDQLSMGYSEQIGPRSYKQRVADIADLIVAMDITGPLWIVAQDWGGAIAMGYAVAQRERVAGLVLSNTGIAVPSGRRAPALIRISASHGLHRSITRHTSLFVAGTGFLPGAGLSRSQRRGLTAPYKTRERRDGVAGFVADVPFTEKHASFADLAAVAEQLPTLDIPVRLWWGAKDPVFNDDFAEDLASRFQNVALHRVANAGHLAVLETSMASFVERAIGEETAATREVFRDSVESLWSRLGRADDVGAVALGDAASKEKISFAEFESQVANFSLALQRSGVRSGDRAAILIPPSSELIAVVYACWRIGAVTVIADRGLGIKGLGRAVRSARVRHVIGISSALVAAKTLRWAPGASMIKVDSLRHVAELAKISDVTGPEPTSDELAAVLFTSGATGPAKGVRYTHGQLGAQRDILEKVYGITANDRFVAAFAPFALFGPALGIATGLADMDVTSPATLTARALDDSCRMIDATMVFASPAALANVVKTARSEKGSLASLAKVRLVLSAGAPVPIETLREMRSLCPEAEFHTPYGMTEILPVADLSLTRREAIGTGRGVCVGQAVDGCEVLVVSMTDHGDLGSLSIGTTGEIVVRAPWMSLGYDRLWLTQSLARPDIAGRIWHRTGDVGHLDEHGNIWVEGRIAHVIHTVSGLVTPVPIEVACEEIPGIARAAAVGIGDQGVQQVVVVVETPTPTDGPAPLAMAAQVRRALPLVDVVAVWTTKKLPVDIRHNSKIDRTALSATMRKKLSGKS